MKEPSKVDWSEVSPKTITSVHGKLTHYWYGSLQWEVVYSMSQTDTMALLPSSLLMSQIFLNKTKMKNRIKGNKNEKYKLNLAVSHSCHLLVLLLLVMKLHSLHYNFFRELQTILWLSNNEKTKTRMKI